MIPCLSPLPCVVCSLVRDMGLAMALALGITVPAAVELAVAAFRLGMQTPGSEVGGISLAFLVLSFFTLAAAAGL